LASSESKTLRGVLAEFVIRMVATMSDGFAKSGSLVV
jgi:hypothetical protein